MAQRGKKASTKKLCEILNTIFNLNIDIAVEQQNKDPKTANQALADATTAANDMKKWGCPGAATKTARARKRIASLKKAIARGRRRERSVRPR